ncbi:hypothetical protein KV205_32395 [Streptomyces sp. SKN60]|uniref:hypothetical protein n=1 Tax=Streptomyces sp. SKN60 TaxID=2855506 RepID=UPI0022469355|nr:hypothetical protein [Streptomyces sp. SKN60]MCX2185177.1 hypothetical protein [Streptomyces sp. SKN60]
MTMRVKRVLAAGAAGLLAAVGGVTTHLVTDSPSLTLGIALTLLVTAGTGAQICLNANGASSQAPTVTAAAPGAIAIGGSARGPVSARGTGSGAQIVPGHGITASGVGSVAVGGDALASVRTDSGEAR